MNIKKRIASIDILRGLVMLLMLVDHVRERFFYHHAITDPMTIADTDTALFFTRISTHFCAPVFVFLAGVSAWLYANPPNSAPRSASGFLLKRGLFIILIEVTLINFSWFGNYQALYLQVMWAIGISMVMLSFATALPRALVGLIGFVIVFGHNALAFIHFQPDEIGYTTWTILHDRGYVYISDTFKVKVSYPVLPWVGTIFIGYFAGALYMQSKDVIQRQYRLLLIGTTCLGLLLCLRGFNIYGETMDWQVGASLIESVKSFVNFTKYPPSLDYLLMTLGVATLILALLEKANHRFFNAIEVFGSAPMFFYILHLYVLLVSYKLFVNLFGTTQGEYWGLEAVWQVWMVGVLLAALLYYPVKKFADFKRRTALTWVKYL
jgi:uncharacterized membrane protein